MRFPSCIEGSNSKSKLVAEAYEATDFFSMRGNEGTWLYFTATLIKGSKGNLMGALETLEDITERKCAEEKMRESELRLTELIDFCLMRHLPSTAPEKSRPGTVRWKR